MRGKDDKMRNAKVCRMQLQLYGFTVCKVMSVAAAPATSEEGKSKSRHERASSPLTCESPRALQLLYVCVTQFCNFSSLGNVGRKNRVLFNFHLSCLSCPPPPSLSFERRVGGNLDFLIRLNTKNRNNAPGGGKEYLPVGIIYRS